MKYLKRRGGSKLKTEKDLIWLVWCAPNFFPALVEKTPTGVTVNMVAETWTFRGQTIKFGRAVLNSRKEGGAPQGVYDKTNFSHLQQMVFDYRRLAPKR